MGVCRDMGEMEGNIGLIFEMMENGSLYSILHDESIRSSRNPLSLFHKLRICLDIIDGMNFLHQSGIIHRDLKSGNILIDGDGRCKIADFGLSTFKDCTSSQTTGVMATPAWTAPEVLEGSNFSKSSDVYSFGVIVWEIFSGEVPWKDKPLITIITWVTVQRRRLDISNSFPSEVRGYLSGCFGDSERRPSFIDSFELFSDLLRRNSNNNNRNNNFTLDDIRGVIREETGAIVDEAVTTLGAK